MVVGGEEFPPAIACTQSWLLDVYKELRGDVNAVVLLLLLLLLLVLLVLLLFSLPSIVQRQIGNVVIRP